MNRWFVYFVRTAGGALYAGITTDIDRRIELHRSARGAKYLRGRGPLAIVYFRRVGDRALASRVEHAMKRLAKVDKEALVAAQPSRRRLLARLAVVDRSVGASRA